MKLVIVLGGGGCVYGAIPWHDSKVSMKVSLFQPLDFHDIKRKTWRRYSERG